MILVDTSIWIALLNSKPGSRISQDDLGRLLTCGPVAQEVLQGLRDVPVARAFRDAFLSLTMLSDPLRLSTFLAAADIYAQGRRKGFTIRSGVDCLIAAIALENEVPVWHQDRDFTTIAKYTGLRVVAVQ